MLITIHCEPTGTSVFERAWQYPFNPYRHSDHWVTGYSTALLVILSHRCSRMMNVAFNRNTQAQTMKNAIIPSNITNYVYILCNTKKVT